MRKRTRRTDIPYIRIESIEEINFDDPIVREHLARAYASLLERKEPVERPATVQPLVMDIEDDPTPH